MTTDDMCAKIAENLDPDGDVMKIFVESVWFDRTMYKLNFREYDEAVELMKQ